MEETKVITEAEAKDLILEYAVNNNRNITSHEIHKEVLPDCSIDEIEFLIEKMKNTTDKVADITISVHSCIITATGISKRFLEQGGFTKIEKHNLELKQKESERETIELEKSVIDLKLKRWQLKTFWWIFGFAIIGSGLSVYNFINSLSTPKNEEQREQKIEKMELELIKLRGLIHSNSEKKK